MHEVGYWVGMLFDIDKYCRECTVCKSIKAPAPASAPSIGKAKEMIAVDMLRSILVSNNSNHYLLVVQDYMTE